MGMILLNILVMAGNGYMYLSNYHEGDTFMATLAALGFGFGILGLGGAIQIVRSQR